MDRDREKEQLLKRLSMCETEEDSETQKESERGGEGGLSGKEDTVILMQIS